MERDPETILRQSFQSAEEELEFSPEFANRALEAAHAGRRRRTLPSLAAIGAVLVLIVAVTVFTRRLNDGSHETSSAANGPGITPSASTPPLTKDEAMLAWAKSLPMGQTPRVAFPADGQLHTPAGDLTLPTR